MCELHHQLLPDNYLTLPQKDMLHNVGKIDRIVRLSSALVFVILYYLKINNGAWDSYFIFGAVLLLVTSIRRCCPLYALLGFGTCSIHSDSADQKIKTKKVKLNK